MNSKELYVCLHAILSVEIAGNRPRIEDMKRDLAVHISRNHSSVTGDANVSHATLEFKGIRAKFLCSFIFDGAGPHDTSVHNFSMPRQKMTMEQKALAALAVIQYLITNGFIDGNIAFFREKFHFDVNGGVGDLLNKYDVLVNNIHNFVEKNSTTRTAQIA